MDAGKRVRLHLIGDKYLCDTFHLQQRVVSIHAFHISLSEANSIATIHRGHVGQDHPISYLQSI